MAITEELADAYFAAEYRVFDPLEGPLSFKAGSRFVDLVELHAWHAGPDSSAFLTAYNPESMIASEEDNKAAQSALTAEVERQWHYMTGEGADPSGNWPPEPSILIFGITLDEARALACKYKQNAFLSGNEEGFIDLVPTDPSEQGIVEKSRAKRRKTIQVTFFAPKKQDGE